MTRTVTRHKKRSSVSSHWDKNEEGNFVWRPSSRSKPTIQWSQHFCFGCSSWLRKKTSFHSIVTPPTLPLGYGNQVNQRWHWRLFRSYLLKKQILSFWVALRTRCRESQDWWSRGHALHHLLGGAGQPNAGGIRFLHCLLLGPQAGAQTSKHWISFRASVRAVVMKCDLKKGIKKPKPKIYYFPVMPW